MSKQTFTVKVSYSYRTGSYGSQAVSMEPNRSKPPFKSKPEKF